MGGAVAAEAARDAGIPATEVTLVQALAETLVADALSRIVATIDDPVALEASVDGTLLRLTVRDRGIPLDGSSLPPLASALLDAGAARGVQVAPPGPDGNAVTIELALPAHRATVGGLEPVDVDDLRPDDEPLELRRMRPDEALAVSQGIYRCYGYTYPDPEYYFPERLAVRASSPDWYSYVAVTSDGQVVAHLEQDFSDEGRVVHSGGAYTDPRYRGRELMLQLSELAIADRALRSPVLQLSEAVTTHTYTQRLLIGSGLIEAGILLAWLPPIRQEGFNAAAEAPPRASMRPGIVLYGAPDERVLHPPAFVADYVRRVVDQHDLPREVASPRPRAFEEAPDRTVRSVELNRELASASISVTEVGRDLSDLVAGDLDDLRRHALHVELRLPATDPALAVAAAGLDELGFVFCGLFPEFRATGDELRLQWLPDAEFDPEALHLYTDFMKALVADVVADVRKARQRELGDRRRRAARSRIFAALG